MSKSAFWFGGLSILLMSAVNAGAADLSRRVAVEPRTVFVDTSVECIRWVRQNQAWYNYCDPVPHFPRTAYGDFWWDYRWYGYKTRWYN